MADKGATSKYYNCLSFRLAMTMEFIINFPPTSRVRLTFVFVLRAFEKANTFSETCVQHATAWKITAELVSLHYEPNAYI